MRLRLGLPSREARSFGRLRCNRCGSCRGGGGAVLRPLGGGEAPGRGPCRVRGEGGSRGRRPWAGSLWCRREAPRQHLPRQPRPRGWEMGAGSRLRALATLWRWLRRGAGRLESVERAWGCACRRPEAAEGEAVAPGAPWGPRLACLRAPELGGGWRCGLRRVSGVCVLCWFGGDPRKKGSPCRRWEQGLSLRPPCCHCQFAWGKSGCAHDVPPAPRRQPLLLPPARPSAQPGLAQCVTRGSTCGLAWTRPRAGPASANAVTSPFFLFVFV